MLSPLHLEGRGWQDRLLLTAPTWTPSCEGSSFLLILPDALYERRFRANGSHVMVDKGLSALTSTSEPRVMVSLSRGSSAHEPLSLGTPLGTITCPRSLTRAQFELNISSGLHYACACAQDPDSTLHPCLLVHRPYVGISWVLPQALAS